MSTDKSFEANQYHEHGQPPPYPVTDMSAQVATQPYQPVSTPQMPQLQHESNQAAPPPYTPPTPYQSASPASIDVTQQGYSVGNQGHITKPVGDQTQHYPQQIANTQYPQVQGHMPMASPQPMAFPPQQIMQQQSSNVVIITNQPQPDVAFVQPVQLEHNWFIPAVLVCVFCFWPTGIVAILAANQANNAAARGDVIGTTTYTRNARIWIFVSLGLGLTWIIILIITSS